MMNITQSTQNSQAAQAVRKASLPRGPRTSYRRGGTYAREMGAYAQAIRNPKRERLLPRRERTLVRAMRETVTAREAECMDLYYAQGLNYSQISDLLGINVSTISRNVRRGENKINRLLDLSRALLHSFRRERAAAPGSSLPS